MKRIENYDEIKVSEGRGVLPVGGYECVIKNVKHFEHNGIKKVSLEIDIANGDYKNYYQEKYDSRDENAKYWDDGATLTFLEEPTEERDKSYFKGLITAIESYNPNYKWNWEEDTLKGLKVNCNFSLKEYTGNDGRIYTKPQVGRYVNSKDNFKKDYVPTVRTINNEFVKYEDYKNKAIVEDETLKALGDIVEIDSSNLPF